MKIVVLIAGMIGLVAGLFFAAQGAGLVTWPAESFMVNSIEWIVYGLLIAGLGLILIGLGTRRRARPVADHRFADPDSGVETATGE